MTLFIRICVWIVVTLLAALASITFGIVMTNGLGDRDDACVGIAIVSILALGGSLTVNLIQAGYI